MNKPHKHAEIIKDWADGAEIEFRRSGMPWKGVDTPPAWHDYNEYRVVPKIESSITSTDMYELFGSAPTTVAGLRLVANEAVRKHIENTKGE